MAKGKKSDARSTGSAAASGSLLSSGGQPRHDPGSSPSDSSHVSDLDVMQASGSGGSQALLADPATVDDWADRISRINASLQSIPRGPRTSLKEAHVWADQRHVVVVALSVLAKRVTQSWLTENGSIVENAFKRLARYVWARLCERHRPQLRQQRCLFCQQNDVRCFEVTLPNPLGIAGWTPDGSCTCCIARARKCTPGTESRNPSTYFGETLDADFLANSPDFVTKLKRNHFLAESSEDGVPNRATVRGRDCAPLTQEESDHVSALLLQILQQSDRQFRRSFFNVLEAAFPVDTDNDGQ
ncbi:related to RMD1-cytoplasmic protein required for sporulation [Sporisorium scitamineum]|uniref:Related to RMD1-cytoplasmic protein required for sporulation n=1 Tax=Sporisorium scitamineum TaxID=49012 RepID=A0A127Z3W6_9BASI|nr:related to RMD1-cytoplasmic protein required for sporulation [Sporisorium scitamineum]